MWPGPRSTTVPSGILIHPAVWPQQTWAADYTDENFESGGCCPFREGGAGSPSKKVWPGPRPSYLHTKAHLDPSNRLATIHQRHRQDRQTGQRSDSIGRTVLQTVAQKLERITWLTNHTRAQPTILGQCPLWPNGWMD